MAYKSKLKISLLYILCGHLSKAINLAFKVKEKLNRHVAKSTYPHRACL